MRQIMKLATMIRDARLTEPAFLTNMKKALRANNTPHSAAAITIHQMLTRQTPAY